MKNVNELRVRLTKVFDDLESGAMDTKRAAELANVAGKMIQSSKVQLEYYALRKEKPMIVFLRDSVPPGNGK